MYSSAFLLALEISGIGHHFSPACTWSLFLQCSILHLPIEVLDPYPLEFHYLWQWLSLLNGFQVLNCAQEFSSLIIFKRHTAGLCAIEPRILWSHSPPKPSASQWFQLFIFLKHKRKESVKMKSSGCHSLLSCHFLSIWFPLGNKKRKKLVVFIFF